eukprot:COSAG01_NODE_31_length_35900_cov_44.332169_16_plen_45_part_00
MMGSDPASPLRALRAVEEWGSFAPNIYRGDGYAGHHRGDERRHN